MLDEEAIEYFQSTEILVPAAAVGWTGVTSGLTHHWPMDDANVSGTTIIDIIAGLNGTATGAGVTSAVGPSGAVGTARQFNQVDTIASFASNPFADLAGVDSTICIWIFSPDVTNGGPDGAPFYFNFTDGTNATGVVQSSLISPVDVEFGNSTGNDPGGSVTGAMVSNVWYHVCETHSGGSSTAGTILYINGTSFAFSPPGQSAVSTGNRIGARGAGSRLLPNGNRVGRIVTYNRVLSGAEINQNFAAF